eukprot:scaffold26141_cov152-Cylindrotheca_fusiformis.AAC.1
MITPSSALKNPYSKVVPTDLSSYLPLNVASSNANSPVAAPCKTTHVHHRDLQEDGVVVPSRILLHDSSAASSDAKALSGGIKEDPDLKNNEHSTTAITTSTAVLAATNSTMKALANTQQDCGRFLSIKNTAATRHHPNDDDGISAPKNIPPPMLGEEGNGLPRLNSKQAQAVQAIKDGKN